MTRALGGGKKIKGRKRTILVDTMGLVLAVCVHSAGRSDHQGLTLLALFGSALWQCLQIIWVDSTFGGKDVLAKVQRHYGWKLEVVKRSENQKGFVLLPKRWVVERTFGTPQGGVVSPLLANIALHGMEAAIGVQYNSIGYSVGKRGIVRYADDFAAFCESKAEAEAVVEILRAWLQQRGLELSAEKTKIVHLSEGFDFLGFNIRYYRAEKTSKTGWKLLIKPSKESVNKIRKKLREQWLSLRGSNVLAIINQLNPMIRGWANYFRCGVSREIFERLDYWMFHRSVRYVKHTHPNKSRYWCQNQYWGRLNLERNDRWVFGDKTTGVHLLKFSWFKIERHILVKGRSSPDDPNLRSYWQHREKTKAKALIPSKQKIAQNQGCLCPQCGESLFNGEELHGHHIEPKRQGGSNRYENLQLLHLYCHQQIHAAK